MDYIVTSHLNPHLSGVAKFNRILAQRMNIPCISFDEVFNLHDVTMLLSIKLKDGIPFDHEKLMSMVNYMVDNNICYDLFFHTYDRLPVEDALIQHCRSVFCGNDEIKEAVGDVGKPVLSAWCPPLVNQEGHITESMINIFSFGMAHKIQVRHYKVLRDILEKFRLPYSFWVSTAFHEKASFGDFSSISHEMTTIFGSKIQFLGFLSDDAVNYFLDKTHIFTAFFQSGVRANNTSVFAAMQRGCAVLTNLDRYSPKWLAHGTNILDINQLQREDLELNVLRNIGAYAKRDADIHSTWHGLESLLKSPGCASETCSEGKRV
ncbi:MAG: hypothetical protein AB1454_07790 [Candidatus Auribacterota bacterium]